MAYGSMRICEALQNIGAGTILLPAIQRKFVWNWRQIEALFDSIMQGYPINTFMYWRVTSLQIKMGFRFYRVLNNYVEKFETTNPEVPTPAIYPDFDAVIDGQQRLTSIFLGLTGTYAYKLKGRNMPRIDDVNILPRRQLYLDLVNEAPENDASGQRRKYVFRFMRNAEVQAENAEVDENHAKKHFWYPVGDVLRRPLDLNGNVEENIATLTEAALGELGITPQNGYPEDLGVRAINVLGRLIHVVYVDQVIHFYREDAQDVDHVLDLFIRTNSGGTKLEFADLLMSIATRYWDGDARGKIDGLIRQIGTVGFDVTRDWVLKACLYLTGAHVKFKVESFTPQVVRLIDDGWNNISTCLINTVRLLREYGYKNESVRAKNAILPIAYFLYKSAFQGNRPLYLSICDNVNLVEMQKSIIKWMNIIILKHTFSAQSDNVLEEMRTVIDNHLNGVAFPLNEMIARYEGTTRDLRFDDAAIERVIALHKNNPDCRALLMLLRPQLSANVNYDIDHLHPHDAFRVRNLNHCEFLADDVDLKRFYMDDEHWDTVPNLHLLDFSANRHKGASPLIEWVNDPVTTENAKAFVLVPENCSLEFSNFRNFYETRKEIVRNLVREAVAYVDHPIAVNVDDGDDGEDGREEVGEEENERINAEREYRRNLAVALGALGMMQQELEASVVDCRSAYDLLIGINGEAKDPCRYVVLELLRRRLGLEEAPRWRDIKHEFREVARRNLQGNGRRRDTTKYNFDDKTGLNHQEMVEAVVSKYIQDNPNVNLEELQIAFPRGLQGSIGCVVATDSELFRNTRPISFRRTTIHLLNGMEIAICCEWGRKWGAGNIPRFIDRARELGYTIEEIPPPER